MKTMMAGLTIALAILSVRTVAAAGADKTLVSWVILDNTTQQGGSALTIQYGDQFDGIVFGERIAGKWMAGSNFYTRTQGDQQPNPVEKADGKTLIQMAIVYQGRQISIYRNGAPYASYEADNIDLLSATTTWLSSACGMWVPRPARCFRVLLTTPASTIGR